MDSNKFLFIVTVGCLMSAFQLTYAVNYLESAFRVSFEKVEPLQGDINFCFRQRDNLTLAVGDVIRTTNCTEISCNSDVTIYFDDNYNDSENDADNSTESTNSTESNGSINGTVVLFLQEFRCSEVPKKEGCKVNVNKNATYPNCCPELQCD